MSDSHLVFVGLGNPGLRYEMTRHNMGFLVIKALAKQLGWSFKEEKRFNSMVVKGKQGQLILHLLMPLTFMNLIGTALGNYLNFYKLTADNVVVVVDDVALPLGQMRLKVAGSAGGHNGLKSIEYYLGTAAYKRLRIGVGHPGTRNLADYVLEAFGQDEQQNLSKIIDYGAEVLLRLTNEDISLVMNMVNTVLQDFSKKKSSVEEPIDLTKPLIKGEEITHEST